MTANNRLSRIADFFYLGVVLTGMFSLMYVPYRLINFIGHSVIPNDAAWGIASYISLPASIGEIGTCLWLLLVGARENLK